MLAIVQVVALFFKSMSPNARARPSSRVDPAAQALSEAEAAKQRGERRKGLEAVQCFQKAIESYELALRLGLSCDDQSEAFFGLGWCLQLCADATWEASHALPDEAASWEAERQSRQAACDLYRRAVAAYRQAVGESGQVREDAAVNCGNTWCSLAELLSEAPSPASPASAPPHLNPDAAGQPAHAFQQAGLCYQAALSQDPEDAATWSNLADCLTSYAQLLADAPGAQGQGQGCAAESARLCAQALESYERSCSLCDSAQGDDLPGLLCNWGSGLLAAAQMTEDPASRTSLLQAAAARLQQSSSFAHADPEPLIRLAEVYSAQAELEQQGQGQGQEQKQGHAAGAVAVQLLRRALEEGYARALAINRSNTEALVGAAETHAALAKLLTPLGEGAAAGHHWAQCLQAYSSALQNPARVRSSSTMQSRSSRNVEHQVVQALFFLNISRSRSGPVLLVPALGTLSERCSVRFNFACALACHGQEEQVHALLSSLLACKGVTCKELAEDPDLGGFRSKPWFQELMMRACE